MLAAVCRPLATVAAMALVVAVSDVAAVAACFCLQSASCWLLYLAAVC